MKQTLFCLFLALLGIGELQAQSIVAGPMLGYNTMREVAVWIQISGSYVQIQYWDTKQPGKIKRSGIRYPENQYANTATLVLGPLEPGTSYNYQVIIDDKVLEEKTYSFTTQSLWQFRTDPPEFSFLAGSCAYINDEAYDRPGTPYGRNYDIFESMAKEEDARFMMWLGDNIYLREADFYSRSGIYHRNSHTRKIPELQSLLSKMHHYAIWDDHDYGPNDSDYTYSLKDITKEAFMNFWANPVYGVGGSEGITGHFVFNDCEFFLMDNRWYREPQAHDATYLGDVQIKWLIDALRNSKASIKFICIGGQVLSDYAMYENYAVFSDERNKLLRLLDEHNIENIVFLTGDRHHSEVSKYTTQDGQVWYDITSSALTSKTYDHSKEENHFRLDKKAIIDENNYAVFNIDGKYDDRKVEVVFKDKKGKKIKSYKLEFK